MKNWILLGLTLFLVKVKVPFGADETYRHVKSIDYINNGQVVKVILSDDRVAFVPAMWTTIEEEKKGDKDE